MILDLPAPPAAVAPAWRNEGGIVTGNLAGGGPAFYSLGAAPSAAFSLRFTLTINGGRQWHSAGAYFEKLSDDRYRMAYLSAESPETKAQLSRRNGTTDDYPAENAFKADWKLGRVYRVELRVRPPYANLLVDGKLCCTGDASADAMRDVGLAILDAEAEFSDIQLGALPRSARVIHAVIRGAPALKEYNTKPVSTWGEYIDKAAAFFASDAGIETARRDPAMGTVPPYVYHAVLEPDNRLVYDGAYPAFHHALLIRAFLNAYRYYGDAKWLERARLLADWNIAHRSPPDCLYPNLPYSTVWEGRMGGFQDADGLMLDKVGWTGLAYLRLFSTTGDVRYRDAAKTIGETLLKVQNADGSWSFRIRLHDPVPLQPYTANQIFNIQFLDRLSAVLSDNRYGVAAARAWKWMEANPVQTNKWENFYEDVGPGAGSIGNWDAIEAGLYMAGRGDTVRAAQIADWVRTEFGMAREEGGIAIREQTVYMVPMNCHTMHWCELLAALYRATGKREYRQAVLSAVNLCTANTWKDGRSPTDIYVHGPDATWYSLCASPLYLGLDLMADFPEQAPANENHILASNADVRSVKYGESTIAYETSTASTETLKLISKPSATTLSGKPLKTRWDGKRHLLTIKHDGGVVKITLQNG